MNRHDFFVTRHSDDCETIVYTEAFCLVIVNTTTVLLLSKVVQGRQYSSLASLMFGVVVCLFCHPFVLWSLPWSLEGVVVIFVLSDVVEGGDKSARRYRTKYQVSGGSCIQSANDSDPYRPIVLSSDWTRAHAIW